MGVIRAEGTMGGIREERKEGGEHMMCRDEKGGGVMICREEIVQIGADLEPQWRRRRRARGLRWRLVAGHDEVDVERCRAAVVVGVGVARKL